ncbi:MAG: alkyl hydroperoxide reductase subunit F [Actinomycetales bacterium]|nr:MAG: alkyl hydroperoxide reductase subunit F [Actinomycetales bacterium]
MLDQKLTATLKAYLERLTEPVELIASLDDSRAGAQTRELLGEIAALSDLVTTREASEAEADPRRPSFAIARPGTDVAVRFAGLPMGHEFTSLVLAILQVGGVAPKVSEESAAAARGIEGEHHFETYMSLTCQNCPDVVQALNAMSVLNPRIHHVAIEGGAYQGEIEDRKVLAVPTVYRNGELFGHGRMSFDEIVAKLDVGATAREAERLAALEPFDVLVVGGGPAGAAAAIYAARKGIRTGIVAERFGGQVMDTMAIENFISVPRTEGPKLAASLEEHVRSYDVEVMERQRATALQPAEQPGGLAEVRLDNGAMLRARNVIVATGARWRHMGVPGEADYRNKGVTFCPHCDGPLFAGKRVAVVGGGNSGIEAAIDLAGVVGHVTVLEFLDELRADAVLQRKLYSLPNVEVILSAKTTEVRGDGDQVTGLDVQDRASGQSRSVDVEGVFVQIGLLPNTDWLGDAVELSARGEVVIDEHGQTSAAGVFAAGDCTTVPYKQIVISLGAGAVAALAAFDRHIRITAPDEAAVERAATQATPAVTSAGQ